jgi:type IV secretion system protein VirB11
MNAKTQQQIALDSLAQVGQPILTALKADGVKDVCINEPGLIFVDGIHGWQSHNAPSLTLQSLTDFANRLANFNTQGLSDKSPIVSGALPTGERFQAMLFPVVSEKTISLTIRKPSDTNWPLSELYKKGMFAHLQDRSNLREQLMSEAKSLLDAAQSNPNAESWTAFFRHVVESKFNIIFSGAMGSGKTTLLKACLQLVPASERIGTIEDAREVHSPIHHNIVHMTYARNKNSIAKVTAADLLEASLRMKFSRIMLSEIRGGEAFFYVLNVFSGHPGSMTTIHANSANEARHMVALRCAQSEEGRALQPSVIRDLVELNVDMVVHCSAKLTPHGYRHTVEDISFSH